MKQKRNQPRIIMKLFVIITIATPSLANSTATRLISENREVGMANVTQRLPSNEIATETESQTETETLIVQEQTTVRIYVETASTDSLLGVSPTETKTDIISVENTETITDGTLASHLAGIEIAIETTQTSLFTSSASQTDSPDMMTSSESLTTSNTSAFEQPLPVAFNQFSTTFQSTEAAPSNQTNGVFTSSTDPEVTSSEDKSLRYQQPLGAVPPKLEKKLLNLSSSVRLSSQIIIDLYQESDSYKGFKSSLEEELTNVFVETPGFAAVNVTDIIRSNSRQTRQLPTGGQALTAIYTIALAAQQAVYENDKVRGFIDIKAIDRLKDINIPGVTIDRDYVEAHARKDLLGQLMVLPSVCGKLDGICPLCYRCTGSGNSTSCVPQCDANRNKVCAYLDDKGLETACHCNRSFVPVGEFCVHQNHIIAAVFGFVGLLMLFALIICICKRKPWRHSKKYTVNAYVKPQLYDAPPKPKAKIVRFKSVDGSQKKEEKKNQEPVPGRINLGFIGDSTSSLTKTAYPTLTRTEASTAVFEDDRLSFEVADTAALKEQDIESFKNYSSSLDNVRSYKDGSSDSELEDYF